MQGQKIMYFHLVKYSKTTPAVTQMGLRVVFFIHLSNIKTPVELDSYDDNCHDKVVPTEIYMQTFKNVWYIYFGIFHLYWGLNGLEGCDCHLD